MPFEGQAGWAKMTSLGDNLTPTSCHPTKKINKACELTYISTNISVTRQ